MTLVSIEREIVEDLISSKLHVIKQIIDQILERWGESDTSRFLTKAKNGILKNAEDDAVELRQLLLDYNRYQKILGDI